MKMMEWKFKIENNSKIKDINVRRELNQIARNQFVRNTKKGIRNTTGSTVKGNGLSQGIAKGYSCYMGEIIGEERRYNGNSEPHTYVGVLRKSAYKVVY